MPVVNRVPCPLTKSVMEATKQQGDEAFRFACADGTKSFTYSMSTSKNQIKTIDPCVEMAKYLDINSLGDQALEHERHRRSSKDVDVEGDN